MPPSPPGWVVLSAAFALLAGAGGPVAAQEGASAAGAPSTEASQTETPTLGEIRIARAAGPIAVDGELTDAGWRGAVRVDTFFETNRSDNVTPPTPTVAWLAYDERALYVAFEFTDPSPRSIRAPLSDRDGITFDTDYGGVFLDTRNDGRTSMLFLATPRGVQYDAINSDISGEDASPDFFWESAARITATGWMLEMRLPFSSLRYDRADPQTWGILLYRNYPRDFRYTMFSSRLPRGSNCLNCHGRKLTGLAGLPAGGHLVAAPYVTGRQESVPEAGLGTPLENRDPEPDGGLDLKWTPNADTVLDATVNPDFSQIESDVAQIAANERFALFFPEKRPFFLEGLDLFATPLQAVYTRTVTSPRWGARATGELRGAAYTFLLAEDRGGGSVVLPGPEGSRLAPQDFSSYVAIGRVRRDLGTAFASLLWTAREIDGGGHNRVLGPDFQWRPTEADEVTGQFLWSDTENPERPDLDPEWDGRRLTDHALELDWEHTTRTFDWTLELTEIGKDFRADAGFLPQVGYRQAVGTLARSSFVERGILTQVRPFVAARYAEETAGGDLLLSRVGPGVQMTGALASFAELSYTAERLQVNGRLFSRRYLSYIVEASPSRTVGRIHLEGFLGDDVDVVGARPGDGGLVLLSTTLRPTDHLDLRLDGSRRWLDLDQGGRLFTAEVARLKATYNFTARCFLRLIVQRTRLAQDPALAGLAAGDDGRDDDRGASALFAYKLNWQTVLFVGYGDERALSPTAVLEPAARQAFLKVSYAFQH